MSLIFLDSGYFNSVEEKGIILNTSFYNEDELQQLGFKALGSNVLISKKVSIYSPETISIGHSVRIDDFCVLSGGSGIQLGNFIHIACYSALFGGGGIVMEDFSGLSLRVAIYSESDDFSGKSLTNPTVPTEFKPFLKIEPVRLNKHVIIGTQTTILPGVTIGEGCAVGAHALVIRDCKPWMVYTGNPAKKIKKRSQELLELEQQFLRSIEIN